jgi:uridine kinase
MNYYLQQIVSLANEHKGSKPFFIAIDGHSAAGKSTLAQHVAASLRKAVIVYTDNFYRPMNEEKRFKLNAQEGYDYYYDWQRLKQEVLQPLSVSNVAEFRVYDWQHNQLGDWKRIEPTQFIIVEGCYSARPELEPFFNIVVLVETLPQERQRRQAKRNDATQAWLDRWDAAERFYIETTKLQSRADVVVSGL